MSFSGTLKGLGEETSRVNEWRFCKSCKRKWSGAFKEWPGKTIGQRRENEREIVRGWRVMGVMCRPDKGFYTSPSFSCHVRAIVSWWDSCGSEMHKYLLCKKAGWPTPLISVLERQSPWISRSFWGKPAVHKEILASQGFIVKPVSKEKKKEKS